MMNFPAKPGRKITLGQFRHRGWDTIKMNLEEIRCEVAGSTYLSQSREDRLAFRLLASRNAENLLIH
jgi:hypothetical protein